MYNDEKNLYHYTYRKDGSEPQSAPAGAGRTSVEDQINRYHADQSGHQPPVMDMRPAKKQRLGGRLVAVALACALLGGATGAGIVAAVNGGVGGNETSINISGRPATTVTLKKVDGKSAMTDAENYAANVNSVVSINTASASTNYFGQTVESASSGSGFIITGDGFIVTNYHVIDGATSVKVTLYNGDTYDAAVIGGDEDYDVAVIKVEVQDLQAVTLGDSSTLNVGDRVLAIGNPLGELTFSMSGGMVSSVNRAINVSGTPFNMIQTDASINPGNSGGPLMNSYGEVVGIVSAKYSSYSAESVEGLGFAIPINDVVAMIEDIMTNGYVTNKPYLGVTAGTMTAQMAAQYRYNVSEGVFIYSVDEDGAAAKAGLQMGDVIQKINDTKITSLEDLTAAKKQYSAGDTVTLSVYRGGQSQTLELTWGSKPAEQETDAATGATQNGGSQGGSGNYSGGDMQDLFDYFFNQYGNSGRGGSAS